MKLHDLSHGNKLELANKAVESFFDTQVNLSKISESKARAALNSVQRLLSEVRSSHRLHTSEQDPKYLQAVMLEQALKARIAEAGTVGTVGTSAPSTSNSGSIASTAKSLAVTPPPKPHEIQQRIQQTKDPKMKELLRKAAGGQQISTDDQKKLAALAADQTFTENTPGSRMNKEYSIKYVQEDDVWAVVDSVGNRVESFIDKHEAVQAARKLNSGSAKAPARHRHVNSRGDLDESSDKPAKVDRTKEPNAKSERYYAKKAATKKAEPKGVADSQTQVQETYEGPNFPNGVASAAKYSKDFGPILSKLSKVIDSVKTHDQLDSANNYAELVISRIRRELKKRKGSLGDNEVYGYMTAIDDALAEKERSISRFSEGKRSVINAGTNRKDGLREGKLDDLKDKKAEKDDWFDAKPKQEPAKKKVAGKQYGGSKQKDEVSESATLRKVATAKLVEFYRKHRASGSARVKMVESELNRRKRVVESKRNGRKLVTESEVQQAQVVLAAQDMVDQIQKMIEQASSAQFKDLPALVSQIRLDQGPDQSSQFNQAVTAAFTGLLQALSSAKEQMEGAVDVVTGKAPAGPTINPGDAAPAAAPADAEPSTADAADDLDLDDETADITGFGRERR